MSNVLPSAIVRNRRGGLNVATAPPDTVHAVIGTATDGPLYEPRLFNSPETIADVFGAGHGVKAAAYCAGQTGATLLFVRVPASTSAAYKSAVDVAEIANPDLDPVVTGMPNEAYDVVFRFTTGGFDVGTTGNFYSYSLDGGATFTTPAALGTATSVTLTGTGLSVTFPSGEAVATNDTFRFWTLPAQPSIGPGTLTRSGSSTATITASGSPVDDYEIRLEILDGGTVGTAGINYRISLDDGNTWTPRRALGTASSIAVMDHDIASGITLSLGAGTFDAGDVWVARAYAPPYDAANVNTAIDALDGSAHRWSFLHVAGDGDATKAATIAGKLDALAGDATGATFTFAMLSARDRGAYEPRLNWSARLVDAYSAFGSERIAVGAGRARVTCPISQRRNRRPVAWIVVPRLVSRPIEEDPGRKASGALSADVQIHDSNNVAVEHDARLDPTLNARGFTVLRTYKRDVGVYVCRGNVLSAEGSDITRIAQRRVLDKAAEVLRRIMEEQLENDLYVNPAGTANAGALREEDCSKLDREIQTGLASALGAAVSAISVRVSRTDQVLTNGGKLTIEVSITGLAYLDTLEASIGYTNPRLAAIQTPAT